MTEKKSTLRERTRRAVREELIDLAQELFAENGYDATTVEAIVEAAGISKRSFFRYFDSKEDLVVGKYDAMIDVLVDAFEARPAEEPLWTSLRRMFDVVVDYAEDPALARRMAALDGVIETSDTLRAAYLERWNRTEERVAAAAATRAASQGRPWREDDPVPRAMVGAAVACLESARAAASRTGRPLRELLDEAMDALAVALVD